MEGDNHKLSPTSIGFTFGFHKSGDQVLSFGVEEMSPAKLRLHWNSVFTFHCHLVC
jgi:hypothetical protein